MHTTTPIHFSDFNTPSILILSAMLLVVVLCICVVAFPVFFLTLPIAACFLLLLPTYRIHSCFILISYACLFLPGIFNSTMISWEHNIISKTISSTGLFLLQYIPSSTPDLPLMFLYFWSLVLVPIAVMETIYWLLQNNKKSWAITFGALITIWGAASIPFGNQCIKNFNAVQQFKGLTLTEQELYEKCGKPLYEEHDRGPRDMRPFWIYTNGHQVIPVKIDKQGNANVLDMQYIFFD